MNNQSTNEMKVPEGYKLVKIRRTESQKKPKLNMKLKTRKLGMKKEG